MHSVGKLHRRIESPLDSANSGLTSNRCQTVRAGRPSPARQDQALQLALVALRLGVLEGLPSCIAAQMPNQNVPASFPQMPNGEHFARSATRQDRTIHSARR